MSGEKPKKIRMTSAAEKLAALRALVQGERERAEAIAAAAFEKTLVPGTAMPDGSVCAGISPDTGKTMYAMAQDGLVTNFNGAAQYAKTLNDQKALGHDDWRVPTKDELGVLQMNKDKGALSETFNLTGSPVAGWYWTSTPYFSDYAWQQRFCDGSRLYCLPNSKVSVRCVR